MGAPSEIARSSGELGGQEQFKLWLYIVSPTHFQRFKLVTSWVSKKAFCHCSSWALVWFPFLKPENYERSQNFEKYLQTWKLGLNLQICTWNQSNRPTIFFLIYFFNLTVFHLQIFRGSNPYYEVWSISRILIPYKQTLLLSAPRVKPVLLATASTVKGRKIIKTLRHDCNKTRPERSDSNSAEHQNNTCTQSLILIHNSQDYVTWFYKTIKKYHETRLCLTFIFLCKTML